MNDLNVKYKDHNSLLCKQRSNLIFVYLRKEKKLQFLCKNDSWQRRWTDSMCLWVELSIKESKFWLKHVPIQHKCKIYKTWACLQNKEF